MDVLRAIDVMQTSDGHYRISWGEDFSTMPVTIRAAASPAASRSVHPAATGAIGSVELAGFESRVRHYFHLQPERGADVVVAQRNVPLEGGVNFRDLGGYATGAGRRVRWGQLFRSGHTANLTVADHAYLATLDIRTVCDFRLPDEHENESTLLPNEPSTHVLAIPPGIKDRYFFHRLFARTSDPQVVLSAMHDMVRSLVVESAPHYHEMFETLLATEDGAILINCSAGKERTGVGAALLLAALGVPRETVLYDYMLSKQYFPAESERDRIREKYTVLPKGGDDRALIMPLLDTRESYLQSAFDAIDSSVGSTEAFLAENYGLGASVLQRLRDKYTI